MKRDTIETIALVALLALAAVTGLGCTRYGIKACSALPHTHQGAPDAPSVYEPAAFIECTTDLDCETKTGIAY